MSTDLHDHEAHEHDLGLAYDLSTLVRRRQALKLFAGAGLVALVGCGSSKSASSGSSTSSGSSASSASTAGTSGTSGTTAGTTATTAGSTATTAKATTATTTAAATTAAGTAATTADVATAIPEETAGPYPGDGSNGKNVLNQSGIVRSDIRSSFGTSSTVGTGVPFTIKLQIVAAGTGKALAGAAVYVWHCDINGNYSLYSQGVTNENYLRGVQETDANGNVSFVSIFPGCYSGRWPHVHYEVYPSVAKVTAASNKIATSQLALPADVCGTVFATTGYSASVKNLSQVSLKTDNVFSDGATRETPTVTGNVTQGYVATLVVPVKA